MNAITNDGPRALRRACRLRATDDVLSARSPGWQRTSWLRRLLLRLAHDLLIRARMRELMPKRMGRVLF